MSEETPTQPIEAPATASVVGYGKVPPAELIVMLEEWKAKINDEISDYDTKKAGIFTIYKRQKELYDKWLSGPMGKMKKLDKLIAGRKKVLLDVDKEINKIKENQIPTTNA
jgi:DNA-directed RNA polymerase specialized sigma54-like protein